MIFYFSATGNDKYVAVRTAEITKDNIYSISDCLRDNKLSFYLNPGENLGLIIPTYFGGFPKIVIDFIKKLNIHFSQDNYVFFIGTYGAGVGGICKEAKNGCLPSARLRIRPSSLRWLITGFLILI